MLLKFSGIRIKIKAAIQTEEISHDGDIVPFWHIWYDIWND
jgi:hypothetical protein